MTMICCFRIITSSGDIIPPSLCFSSKFRKILFWPDLPLNLALIWSLNADDNIIQRSTVELGFNSTGPVTTLSSWGNLSILSILIIMIMTIIIMIMMMVVITMMKNIREFGSLSPPIQRSVSTSTVSTTAKYVCLNWSCLIVIIVIVIRMWWN